MAAARPAGRDIIVIGSSAGGIQALPRLLRSLPPEMPASVFVCQHIARTSNPQLVQILSRATPLPVGWAEQGERIRPGRVYVAPPDLHLTFADHHIRLARGPRENYARPSIDRMFRSAAVMHGERTVAVLLTGMMDDGVAGAVAIQEAGGRVIVQDPSDAAFPELPESALAALTPDALLTVDRIAPALIEMATEVPSNQRTSHNHLAHVASGRQLLAHAEENVEAALWSAVRALHAHATTLDDLAFDARELHSPTLDEYETRAKEAHAQAETARQFLLDLARRR